jgi:nucleotide-binding universal stress UspA family protein
MLCYCCSCWFICLALLVLRSGVGDSIVEFAKAKGVDMVVIGSRGLGSIQR